jgi:hypothetical protein
MRAAARTGLELTKGSRGHPLWLAIDLYVWLTYRMSYIREPTTVPWELLSLQTGAHYQEVRQFRRRALEALPVAAVYPDARVRAATDEHGRPLGLKLEPSPTHVRHRPKALQP